MNSCKNYRLQLLLLLLL